MPAHVQADFGDVEVGHLVVPAEAAGRVHDGDVDAGLLQLLDLLHRQEADVAAIRSLVGGKAAQVDALGRLAQLLVELPARDGALEAPVAAVAVPLAVDLAFLVDARAALAPARHLFQEGRQCRGFDAQELHVDLWRIDGDHRQPAVQAGRQHHAAAGEVKRWRHGFALRRAALCRSQLGTAGALQAGGQFDAVQPVRRYVGQVKHARVVAQHPARRHRLGGGLAVDRALNLLRATALFGLGWSIAFEGLDELLPVLRARQRLGKYDGHRRCAVKQARLAFDHGKRRRGADIDLAGQVWRLLALPAQVAQGRHGGGGSKGERYLQARGHGEAGIRDGGSLLARRRRSRLRSPGFELCIAHDARALSA